MLPRDEKGTLTVERLKSLVRYEPETGKFLSLQSNNQWPAGREIGTLYPTGYRRAGIDGHTYMTHRLAWLYMTGSWPKERIDHKDGNRANNRWNNLRAANDKQNRANSGISRNNKLGIKGVRLHETGRYHARISISRDYVKHLGLFDTAEEAAAAYREAAVALRGEFTRF